jgi:hypothetical protein
MALTLRINLLDNYSSKSSVVQGLFGQVLSGFAIGGTSSGYHELFDVLSSTAKRAKYGDRAGEVAQGNGRARRRRGRRPEAQEGREVAERDGVSCGWRRGRGTSGEAC